MTPVPAEAVRNIRIAVEEWRKNSLLYGGFAHCFDSQKRDKKQINVYNKNIRIG